MDNDKADIVYLDFSKVYKVSHYYYLLVKMKNIGTCKKAVNIVWYFLTNKTMKEKIVKNSSETE